MAPPPVVRLLPHQLVARDDRSSYIKRVDTLAGPGAYVIPSTFKTTQTNPHTHHIQKHHYGREFSRQQRQANLVITGAEADPLNVDADGKLTREERRDRYLERRERLRELLQQLDEQQPQAAHDETSTLVSPFKPDPLPISSPSLSSTSNYDMFVAGYRQHQDQRRRGRPKSASQPSSVRSPTSPASISTYGVDSFQFTGGTTSRQPSITQQATSPATSPALTYRAFLSTTSYSKRRTSNSIARQSFRSTPSGS